MNHQQVPFSQVVHFTNDEQLDAGIYQCLKVLTYSTKQLLDMFEGSDLHEIAKQLHKENSLTHKNMYSAITYKISNNLIPLYVPVSFGYNTFFYFITLKYYPIYIHHNIAYQHGKFRQLQDSYVLSDMKFYYDILHAQANKYIDNSLLTVLYAYYFYRFHDVSLPVYGLDMQEIAYSRYERFTIMSARIIEQNIENDKLNKLVSDFPLNFDTYCYILKQIKYIKKSSETDYKYIPVDV